MIAYTFVFYLLRIREGVCLLKALRKAFNLPSMALFVTKRYKKLSC
jgi:hypothetical protein